MNTVISFEQLVHDFDSLFRHRVFRLETLDWYDAPNEHEPYRRFLAGEPADWTWREPWKRLVRDVRASGRTMERVHIVSEPLSDYMRFEMLRVYPANVEAGEDVRIVSRNSAGIIPKMDFWLFDDDTLAQLHYHSTGRMRSIQLVSRPGGLAFATDIRDRALRSAAPLAQYVAQHNITEERTHAA